MNNNNFNFSEAFLDMAMKALLYSECETDEEKAIFNVLCRVCDKHGISVKKYIEVSTELEEQLKELQSHD